MTRFVRIVTVFLAFCAIAPFPATAQSAPGPDPAPASPLFASDELLELTLVADFATLARDRGEVRPQRPATLRFAGTDGAPAELDVRVRTRGNFRLRRSTCAFPNLRLRFSRERAAGTVFEGIRDLKLVGHCSAPNAYEQNTLEEYLVYRLYNRLTDASFRVRLVRLTYVDANGVAAPVTRHGFLIESDEMLAARLGAMVLNSTGIDPLDLDPVPSARLELFQYMIGNTDFSIVYFHNAILLRLPDGTYQAIPYDFDFSGLVDASYATPDPSLGTRTVRERVFRGFCRPGVEMTGVYTSFTEARADFEEVLRSLPQLEPRGAERAVQYLAEFFRTLETPRTRVSLIERRCRAATP